jgi:hypothetical protein
VVPPWATLGQTTFRKGTVSILARFSAAGEVKPMLLDRFVYLIGADAKNKKAFEVIYVLKTLTSSDMFQTRERRKR